MDNHKRSISLVASIFLLVAAPLSFIACEGLHTNRHGSEPWRDSSLVNQIWDVRAQRIVTLDALLQHAAEAHYVFLGETHDNKDHHLIQAEVLKALIERGARPTLGMEQLDTDHQAAIDNLLATPAATTDALAEAAQFDRKGWNWPLYEPIIAIALQSESPIVAMNLSRSAARRVVAQGIETLGEARIANLALDVTWNEKRNETLRQEITEGHCGHVSEDLLPKLVTAQRVRDATMADALITRATHGAIAIVGHQHARKDIGVPIYLAQRVPTVPVVSIGLIEVDPDRNNPTDYIASDGGQRFDFIWFTPAAKREDPCKGFTLMRKLGPGIGKLGGILADPLVGRFFRR